MPEQSKPKAPKANRTKTKDKKNETEVITPEVVDVQDRRALVVKIEEQVPQLYSPIQKQFARWRTPQYLIKRKPGRGGKYFDYVDVSYVIETLNDLFGAKWSFKQLNPAERDPNYVGFMEFSLKVKQFIVQGELRVPDPQVKGEYITKGQTGRHDIAYLKNTKDPVDLGNDLKAAWSDCLKKCASQLSIALDVYSGEVTRTQDAQHPEGLITEGQRKRLEALAMEAGIGHKGLKEQIAKAHDYTSTKDIMRKHFTPISEILLAITSQNQASELEMPADIKRGFEMLDTPLAKQIAVFRAASKKDEKGKDGLDRLRARMKAKVNSMGKTQEKAQHEAAPAKAGSTAV